MRLFASLLLLMTILLTCSFLIAPKNNLAVSPLSEYSKEWDQPQYQVCNTAEKTSFLTPEERKTIYILNMARMNPALFAKTVIQQYPDKSMWATKRSSGYYISLLKTMQQMKPQGLLQPDSLCFVSALCHATTTGNNGTVTHDRSTTCESKSYYRGECCQYGNNEALEILMSLLIDEGIPSLGHREICLASYRQIGVSIQPHKTYHYTAVLDFH